MVASTVKTRQPPSKARALRKIVNDSQIEVGQDASAVDYSKQYIAQVKSLCYDQADLEIPLYVLSKEKGVKCQLYRIKILEKLDGQVFGGQILPDIDGSQTRVIAEGGTGYEGHSVGSESDELKMSMAGVGGEEFKKEKEKESPQAKKRNILLGLLPEGIYKIVDNEQPPAVNDYVYAYHDNIEGRFLIKPLDPSATIGNPTGGNNIPPDYSSLEGNADFFDDKNGSPVKANKKAGKGSISLYSKKVNWACLTPETKGIIEQLADKTGFNIRISSGFRTASENTRVGGIEPEEGKTLGSYHLRGLAFDIPRSPYSEEQWSTIGAELKNLKPKPFVLKKRSLYHVALKFQGFETAQAQYGNNAAGVPYCSDEGGADPSEGIRITKHKEEQKRTQEREGPAAYEGD